MFMFCYFLQADLDATQLANRAKELIQRVTPQCGMEGDGSYTVSIENAIACFNYLVAAGHAKCFWNQTLITIGDAHVISTTTLAVWTSGMPPVQSAW